MTNILPFPRRLRLVDAVQAAVQRARYEEAASEGYFPPVLPIPPQKPRINCVPPVPVVSSNYADIHDTREHL